MAKTKKKVRNNNKSENIDGFPSTLLSSQSTSKQKHASFETLIQNCVWVLPNFFSPRECTAWTDFFEQNVETNDHIQQRGTRYLAHRECFRYQRHDDAMAQRIFERLSTSYTMPFSPKQQPIACNPNLRLYRYTKGMKFGPHIDESCLVPGVGETGVTVLIYLSSSCRGGATRFVEENVAFQPRAGAALLHVHGNDCLLHEGEEVTAGVKYILRTDLVFSTS